MSKKHINFDILNIPVFFSSFFYVGFFPYAPGTMGSIAACVLYFFAVRFLGPFWYLVLCAAVFFAGTYFSSKAEKISGLNDPSFVVIDEVAGYFIAMSFFAWKPQTNIAISAAWSLCGLALFRFFDIVKPFPVSYVDEKIRGGLGIMLDDVVAGIFSFISIIILHIAFSII